MTEIVSVRFRETGKAYSFDPNGIVLKKDQAVIVETARGIEYGIVTGANHPAEKEEVVAPLRKVLRIATEADRRTAAENRIKEKKAVHICQEKIEEHKIDMKCIDVEYAFDGSKILFYFTADGRVDFRELVKDLAGVFKTRIELRQVGVRDEAKLLGGLGICGRPFCCASFLDDFQPVSIKMAKEQNLSLNPTKISGTCGRLMCCLKYEQEAYEDLIRTTPKVSSLVETPQGIGTVVDVSLMTGKLKVRLEGSADLAPKCFNKCDVCLKRGPIKGGKAEEAVPAEALALEDPSADREDKGGDARPRPQKKQNRRPNKDNRDNIRRESGEGKDEKRDNRPKESKMNRPPKGQQKTQQSAKPAEKPAAEPKAQGERPEGASGNKSRRSYYHRKRRHFSNNGGGNGGNNNSAPKQ